MRVSVVDSCESGEAAEALLVSRQAPLMAEQTVAPEV